MHHTFIEDCRSISINQLKLAGLEPLQLDVNGQIITLTTSGCNYGGKRLWFTCPKCKQRVGRLYQKPLSSLFICRHCNKLHYQLTYFRRSQSETVMKLIHKTRLLS